MARRRSRDLDEGEEYFDSENIYSRNGDDGEGYDFADPGGNSSLRAASKGNPRIYSCPTCKTRRVLTRRDKELGYQCNSCADQQERGGY